MSDKERLALAQHTLINVLDLDTHTLYPCWNFFDRANIGDYIDNVDKDEALNYSGYIKRKVWRKLYGQSHLIIEIKDKL